MELNNQQREAAEHFKGAMLVLAGPGSGKTHTITARIGMLIEERGVEPEKILVITFSRAAAAEMKQRFTSPKAEAVNFGTFHAVFFKILKGAYGYAASDIISEREKYSFIREAVYSRKIKADTNTETLDNITASLSLLKTEGISASGETWEHEKERISKLLQGVTQGLSVDELMNIYRDYERRLREEKKLDFDDMMLKCEELFEERTEVLKYWQERYEYILIDEFQDINNIQYRLIRKLAEPGNNIFAVGDDDQSIYGFRGASPEIMMNFAKDYKDCKTVRLDTNYRSFETVTRAASELISNNSRRFSKKIKSGRGNGGRAEIHHFGNLEEENQFIIKYLKHLMEGKEKLSDCAVLYRINSEIRTLKRQLGESGIPFRIKEKLPNIAEHWITKDITSYLQIAEGSCNRADFLRICNRPLRYISRDSFTGEKVTIDDLINSNRDKNYVLKALEKLKHDISMIKRFDVFAAIRYIRLAVGYDAYVREFARKQKRDGTELFEILGELEEIARNCTDAGEWIECIKHTDDEDKSRLNNTDNAVELMSFHCSKGLEFKTVFIIDANEGFIPQNRAEGSEAIEEERRAFYVAMTRAKDNLFILESTERLGRKMLPSRFLNEIRSAALFKHEVENER